jgi:hypothetical protein
LEKLNPDKSAGPDQVHAYILKSCADELSKPLEMIFSKSLATLAIPRHWKSANITPLFKKGIRLSKLTPKNVKFEWSNKCEESFNRRKDKHSLPLILTYPNFEKTFRLITDASNVRLAAVLCLVDKESNERVIS